jgi:K+-transporting ATPase A subunit
MNIPTWESIFSGGGLMLGRKVTFLGKKIEWKFLNFLC